MFGQKPDKSLELASHPQELKEMLEGGKDVTSGPIQKWGMSWQKEVYCPSTVFTGAAINL